jgi:dipeptidase E
MKRQIIAIGGGGFSRYGEYKENNLAIERYFLEQTGKKRPSICFIPTASGESLKYIVDFYTAFGKLDCTTSHLSLFNPPTADLETFLLEKDAIYVGGGNTKSLMALWKEWKLDIYLKRAWDNGIVLGGISAGLNCWFEECVTDSIPGNLTSLKCLGFLKGSGCPHYDKEEKRRLSYHALIKSGHIINGIAVDDHVAAHFVDQEIVRSVRSEGSGASYQVFNGDRGIEELLIKTDTLL